MRGSWKIGRVAGIDIYLHFTFLLLLAWVIVSRLSGAPNLSAALNGILFFIALFTIVVLHELGHALAARRYGIPTRNITLLPIGGVAHLARMPEEPKQELVVALAGPVVNLVLALGLYFLLGIAGKEFLVDLIWINLALAIFNLLPAFPMDGGRVLRALLAMKMNYLRATNIAATIGKGMAVLFGLMGFFYSPFLVFIAIFVWMAGSRELAAVRQKSFQTGWQEGPHSGAHPNPKFRF